MFLFIWTPVGWEIIHLLPAGVAWHAINQKSTFPLSAMSQSDLAARAELQIRVSAIQERAQKSVGW